MYSEASSNILNRMIGNVPDDVDTSEGSFIFDAVSPVSEEIAQQEINLEHILNMVFAQSAAANGYSAQLDLRCGEFGVVRKIGTLSTGQVTFAGAETTPVPIGTIIQTTSPLQYITTTAGVITNGVAIVNIEAIAIGSIYNVPSNTIIQLPTAVSGITGVANTNPTTGGTDIETDEAMLQRLLIQTQTPSTSGNSAHYIQWGMEVPGIGAVQPFPLWNGPGTVKVCAVDSNMQPLSADLLTALSTYIETQRPIGATVTYESAIALPININVDIVRNTAYLQAQIQIEITNAITNYLKRIATKQSYVSYGFIGSLIMACQGVTDYSSFTVNGGTVNALIGTEQVATIGTVIVNAP